MSVLNVNGFIANGDRCLAFLFAGKGKVVSRIQSLRLVPLEHQAQSGKEGFDGSSSQTVSDSLWFLVRKAPRYVGFGI